MPCSLNRRELLGGIAHLALGARYARGAPPRLRVSEPSGEKVSFFSGDRLLFEYRYSAARPKTYVHPLCAPDGSPLTLDGPADHIHHRGVMIGWTNVNGYEFFGEDNPGLPKGRIVHQRFERVTQDPAPSITAINHWIGGEEVFLIERRAITALPERDNTVRMQWDSEFRASREGIVLRVDKAVYNGLGIRMVHSMDGGSVLNASGADTVETVNGKRAAWAAYTGALDSGKTAGVAIFDHPSNPRHPTPFFVMNRFGYLSAAPTFYEPLPVPVDRPVRFRFAVITFLSEARRDNIEKWFQSWASAL